MKKVVINILKGIVFGNFIANITYVILYILGGNEGGNTSVLQLAQNNNYIKMIVYSSASGILLYITALKYQMFFKKKVEELENFNVGIKKYILNYLLLLVLIIILLFVFKALQLIYFQEEFNRTYLLLIILTYIVRCAVPVVVLIPKTVRQEINWVNENLKNRNIN